MFCPYCGSEIQANTAICVCDAPVESAQPANESDDKDGTLRDSYVPVSKFTFLNFAKAIYHDKTSAHQIPFLLPALYGGNLGQADKPYEALFVLQDPKVSVTEDGWRKFTQPCDTVEKAIQRHREIFLGWAYKSNSNQAFLFERFSPRGADLFQRFYVTDIWKDRKPRRPGSGEDGQYWIKKLKIELREIRADRIIFVGDDAKKYGLRLIRPGSKTPHEVAHPQRKGMTRQEWQGYVSNLNEEIIADLENQLRRLQDQIR